MHILLNNKRISKRRFKVKFGVIYAEIMRDYSNAKTIYVYIYNGMRFLKIVY